MRIRDMNKKPDNKLLANYLSNECTVEEKEEIEIWLQSDPDNKRLMELMKSVWNSPGIQTQEWNKKKLWMKVAKETGITSQSTSKARILPLIQRINHSV